jgi:hypothetical protein
MYSDCLFANFLERLACLFLALLCRLLNSFISTVDFSDLRELFPASSACQLFYEQKRVSPHKVLGLTRNVIGSGEKLPGIE